MLYYVILTLFEILFGIFIGFLFGNILLPSIKYTIKYKGPNSNDIKKKIYINDKNECYKLKPQIHICSSK